MAVIRTNLLKIQNPKNPGMRSCLRTELSMLLILNKCQTYFSWNVFSPSLAVLILNYTKFIYCICQFRLKADDFPLQNIGQLRNYRTFKVKLKSNCI